MSLHPRKSYDIPAETARVATACIPQGHPYLRLSDALGPIFQDDAFAALFPTRGQPAAAHPAARSLAPRSPLLLQLLVHAGPIYPIAC